MPKLGMIISILVLAFSLESFAQSYNEFAGIPFGASRETVIEEIMKMGFDPYDHGVGERVVIPVYKFGELLVQVGFIFNSNDKFYAFEIRTGRLEDARRGKVFDAVNYMSEQFTLKYGKSSGEPSLTEATIREGRNIYQQWPSIKKTLEAVTSIINQNGRYYAVGVVEHRPLSREKAVKKKGRDSSATTTTVF